jgi:hypothetical protein
MENHSEVKEAKIHFVLVKAVQQYQDFPIEDNTTVEEEEEVTYLYTVGKTL